MDQNYQSPQNPMPQYTPQPDPAYAQPVYPQQPQPDPAYAQQQPYAPQPQYQFQPGPAAAVNEMTQAQATAPTQFDPGRLNQLASTVNLRDSSSIITYGSDAQRKLTTLSEAALKNTRTSDMGETGELLSGLIADLKNFKVAEEEKGFMALFKKSGNKVKAMHTKYNSLEKNVDVVVGELERHQATLMKDIRILDDMYNENLEYYKSLEEVIAAGEQKLSITRSTELADLNAKAAASGDAADAQNAKDLADACDRFEKKLHDLRLTKTISLQTGPQIRMVQTADSVMVEKIQSTINNTIPLWKNQMVIAIGVEHSAQAAKVQREVTDMTNELLQHNADMLKTATITAAQESERGIVDIDTLKHTNEQLISTLDEVLKIQEDGKNKRREAEKELAQIEDQLKQKMLNVASQP